MTECERIVKEGVLPESFFKAETICDFFVDENRKRVWAIGIDLLLELDRVCERYQLKYTLAYGSLLGWARHRGFIPWDDDIDVVMPRNDYEKLRKLSSEFKEPYYLQFPGDVGGYCFSFAKLRNSNTSGISYPFRYEQFNQGLFLDIFPLDNFSEKNLDYNLERLSCLVAEGSALMRRSNPNPDNEDIIRMNRFPVVRNATNIASDIERILQINSDVVSDKYIVWSCLMYDYHRMVFPKYMYDNLKRVELYNHGVWIPEDYDSILRITYKDWHLFPPLKDRGLWHSKNIIDPTISYKILQKKMMI